MQVGIFYMPTAYTADVVTLARRVEELGFESLWAPDHPVMPVDRTSPFPGGGEMPDSYAHLMDPLVTLAAAAGATERIRLGTGIVLAAEREPLVLAKEVATLDLVSNGRFEFGIGAVVAARGGRDSRGALEAPLGPCARARPRDEGMLA